MKRVVNYRKFVAIMAIMAFCLVLTIPQAFAGEVWQQKFSRFSATAGETLSIGDVVCIFIDDGKAYKADANDSTLRPAVGVIGKGGAANSTVEIVTEGILAGQTEISVGVRLYLSTTAGAITATAPTNGQSLGFVLPPLTAMTGTSASPRYYIKVEVPVSDGPGY